MAKRRTSRTATRKASPKRLEKTPRKAPERAPKAEEEREWRDPVAAAMSRLTPRSVFLVAVGLLLVLAPAALYVRSSWSANANARKALDAREWQAAERSLRKAIRRSSDPIPLKLELARCLLELNRPAEALEVLNPIATALEEPKHKRHETQFQALRGWGKMQEGDTEGAARAWTAALAADPKHPLASALMGQRLLDQGQPERAADCFKNLIGNPEFADRLAEFNERVSALLLQVPDSELADVPERLPERPEPAPPGNGAADSPAESPAGGVQTPVPTP
jgi:thioredoxin-like negative regulator of GroEL